ncbi:cation-translocating P-type ATPase [Anaeromicrobium sediminis]|uniref:Haloacid dehalogenase n=1 Tax=Anaeromicrobium sediminis TaxID=1478221 RepID=A0A267MLB3_9FIRM|nr:HAD-IC family P-type ATPase [Anaeromicrobium sediminis]PAB60381.1 haloacid dehalogenase [Anaeromicrobium sediminis]
MFQALKNINKYDDDILYKRIRIPIQSIYRNESLAKKTSNFTLSLDGVKYSKANPLTSKILIVFDEELTNENLLKKEIYKFITKATAVHNSNVISIEVTNSKKEFPSNSKSDFISTKNINNQTCYHALSKEHIEKVLKSNYTEGLNNFSIEQKQKEFGLNVIYEKEEKSLFSRFIESLKDPIIKILLGSGVVSLLLGQIPEAIALGGIILFQSAIGAIEQHKSDNSLDSLKDMLVHKAKVIRNGKQQEIDSKYLVPGDIIIVESGDKIPADARIIECKDLKTSESSLTGESTSVIKSSLICDKNTDLGSMTNILFMGTNVLSGRGKAVVISTGRNTEIGKIASMLDSIENEETPLQRKSEKFINKLIKIYLGFFAVAGGIALLSGMTFAQVLMMGVTFFLGSIPEGFPVMVTTCMALSVHRMAKKNAVVRKLNSVETLGCADVICCDKTGTLTMNEMTVRKIYVDSCLYNVSGSGYKPSGEITPINGNPKGKSSLENLLKTGVLCNNSLLLKSGDKWEVQGDPTEGALLTAAYKMNINVDNLRNINTMVQEIPFDSNRRFMTTVMEYDMEKVAYCKGALDTIIEKCTMIYEDGKERLFTSKDKEKIQSICDKMADDALRVLAFAYKKVEEDNSNFDNGFVFIGFVGMEDPPREGVNESIQKCFKAGIKVVMITGDHMRTASAIGKQLGLLTNGLVVSGAEVDNMTDSELDSKINHIQVFARTTPKQKHRIVKALKRCGHIVAMTGDGVNDAPAIKEAHIGIAMGMNGSDVARDAACITLVDDNFSTIVTAIEEGRGVSNNIGSTMKYLFSGAIGEMFSIFLSFVFRTPAPLIAMQMIWINLLSETLLGSSLSVELPSEDVMNYPPVDKNAPLIDRTLRNSILRKGIVIGVSTFAIFKGALLLGVGLNKARTLALSNFVFNQVVNVYTCRKNKKNFNNKYLNRMALITVALLMGIIYIPVFNNFFGTVPLDPLSWVAVLGTTALSGI